VSTYATIKAAVKNHEKRTIALHSFVIALLPFFNPTLEQKTKYETHGFALAGDVKEYLAVYDVDKVWSALAYYAQVIGFQFRAELHVGLSGLALQFYESQKMVTEGHASAMLPIEVAIKKWRPVVRGKQVEQFVVSEMAAKVCNVLLVEYARTYDIEFEVFGMV